MKKCILALSFFIIILTSVLFIQNQTVSAAPIDELELLEGDWYANSGNLYASIHERYFNSCLMNFIEIAGGSSNFAITVQVREDVGYRHIRLYFSNLREGYDRYNPFYKPIIRVEDTIVHKKNFNVPNEVYSELYGDWYGENENLVASVSEGAFDETRMFFIDFYGTKRRYTGTLQINDGDNRKYFEVVGSKGNVSLRNITDKDSYESLHKK